MTLCRALEPEGSGSTRRLFREVEPWKSLLERFDQPQIDLACERLTIDTSAPAATLNFASPGPAERALLRRVVEDLGAGRPPNAQILPDHAALALASAATAARAVDGHVDLESVAPRIGLTMDFGAVADGHHVEPAVEVSRSDAETGVRQQIEAVASAGGWVLVRGGPGIGKSWLCEQLADGYRHAGWTVARHHC